MALLPQKLSQPLSKLLRHLRLERPPAQDRRRSIGAKKVDARWAGFQVFFEVAGFILWHLAVAFGL